MFLANISSTEKKSICQTDPPGCWSWHNKMEQKYKNIKPQSNKTP